jgi:hypothetical protein
VAVNPRSGRTHGDGSAVGDAVNGAFAVLAIAAALVRYAAEAAARSRLGVVPRLPFTGEEPGLRRVLHGSVVGKLARPASAAMGALAVAADEWVPGVSRAVLARLDVRTLVREFVDLDRLAALLDVDAVVARVDLDRAVDRVDIDRVIARTDVAGLARYVGQEIDLPGLLRASTGSMTSEMVRGVRDQGADADVAVERAVDRLPHRYGRRTGPAEGGLGTGRRAAHDDR